MSKRFILMVLVTAAFWAVLTLVGKVPIWLEEYNTKAADIEDDLPFLNGER